jgi:hypothetical protein
MLYEKVQDPERVRQDMADNTMNPPFSPCCIFCPPIKRKKK